MSKKTFGQLIRSLRQAKGISLRKLAEEVDVSFVNIAHIENDKVKTSKKTIQQLAKALGQDVDELLARAEEISDDIEDIIRKQASTLPSFLRSAKNLTKEQWLELAKQVEEMGKKDK
ncbi:MAG: helix-turn-helix transcriptional regulator [Candidatus Marinimicrobia bacterium]|jgi:transcriptional regulator with XRE-family HTH domain|nr:helix-turn-helix transcriptional regulator [Candidatus Neomarinimicrobiota bacterium]MDP7527609.1 helix-turn-helix transcriptional regulator [Candidatus Neomarinimicrobiota bacterium]|tara:strand:+ start:284 stop:634 length:351 start_codon:yes stop_codon:yes gene_type:complete